MYEAALRRCQFCFFVCFVLFFFLCAAPLRFSVKRLDSVWWSSLRLSLLRTRRRVRGQHRKKSARSIKGGSISGCKRCSPTSQRMPVSRGPRVRAVWSIHQSLGVHALFLSPAMPLALSQGRSRNDDKAVPPTTTMQRKDRQWQRTCFCETLPREHLPTITPMSYPSEK